MKSINIHEDKWIAIKIFLTVFLISGFFFKPDLGLARFDLLTKALAHYGTTSIEKIQQISGIKGTDQLIFNGHVYLQPTPGLSFIALASYLPYAILLQSRLTHLFSLNPSLEFKISQFVMALSTVTLFTALLIAIFFLSLRKIGCTQKKAIIFSFLLYFGTPVIFYSLNITNGQDILQTAVLFTAFFIFINRMPNIRLVFLSGLLCGLAVFVNVTSLFFLPLFIFIILFSKRWQNLLSWILGVILGLLPLLIYNQISFGNFLRFSYSAKFGSLIPLHPLGSFNVAGVFLISPKIGLLFFFPFVIMLAPMFKRLWRKRMNKFILFSVLFYIGCIFIINQFIKEEYARLGCRMWYLSLGGGGPRYLLPIIPFLLYAIASTKFDLEWKKKLASMLMFISVIINTPSLFWSGGQAIFYNNLLLFLKNGFHSYMLDLIRDILINKGFNTSGLSIFPSLTILGIFLCWIWIGNQWVRRSF